MPTKWYTGVVHQIIDENPRVKRFFIEVEGVEKFDFLPGQFITVDLPISEKRLGRWRSYSIANPPNGDNMIELCIVNLEGGAATAYLFEEIKVGDAIRFKGPEGGFVLPANLDQDIIMLCTGTGVAPFRSMLRHIVDGNLPHKKIHLIYGGRNREEILYEDEFLSLNKEMEGFEYDVALSREQVAKEEGSHLHPGRIHRIYMEQYRETSDDRKFLICGWSQMIDEAVSNLITGLGYGPGQLKYELYG